MICRRINHQSLTPEPQLLKLSVDEVAHSIEIDNKPVHL